MRQVRRTTLTCNISKYYYDASLRSGIVSCAMPLTLTQFQAFPILPSSRRFCEREPI